jgi:hypothetical protein
MKAIQTSRSTSKEAGRVSQFSRRGMLFGAAALAAARWTPAKADTLRPEATNLGPPYAYTGCYTGGSNTGRGISVLSRRYFNEHADPVEYLWPDFESIVH